MITKEYLQQELAKRIDGYKRGVETTTDDIIAEMKSILVLVDGLEDNKYNDNTVIIDDFVNIPSAASELGFNHIFPDNEAEIIKKLGLKDGDEVTVQIRKKRP